MGTKLTTSTYSSSGLICTSAPGLIDFSEIAGTDQLLVQIDTLEKQNKELRSDVDRLIREMSELRDSFEYKTWCSEGMPGLIKPEIKPPCEPGMVARIVNVKGPGELEVPGEVRVRLVRSREKDYGIGPFEGIVSDARVSSDTGVTQWLISSPKTSCWIDLFDLVIIP